MDATRKEMTEQLARAIESRTGIVIPEGQHPHLWEVLQAGVREGGFPNPRTYLAELSRGALPNLWKHLLAEVTVKESFLFRVPEQFRALREEILPRLADARGKDHRLRVWSAGCARGEEPTTLATVMADCPQLLQHRWEILATDIDEEALRDARRAEYTGRSVARVPPRLLRTYFTPAGQGFQLRADLREKIEFRAFNFFDSPYLSLGASFDIIFLRNVLIYFTPDSQRQVLCRVLSRLAPDGYLFLGSSETLWQLTDELEPLELDACFVYRRRAEAASRRRSIEPKPSPVKRRHEPEAVRPPMATVRPSPRVPVSEPEANADPAEPAIEGGIPAALEALHAGRLDRARELVEACLAVAPTDWVVHTLKGLVDDLEGRAEQAVAAYRAALFLDPGVVEVRFLLARQFEKLDHPERAVHEYRRILADVDRRNDRPFPAHLELPLPHRETILRRCHRVLRGSAGGNPTQNPELGTTARSRHSQGPGTDRS